MSDADMMAGLQRVCFSVVSSPQGVDREVLSKICRCASKVNLLGWELADLALLAQTIFRSGNNTLMKKIETAISMNGRRKIDSPEDISQLLSAFEESSRVGVAANRFSYSSAVCCFLQEMNVSFMRPPNAPIRFICKFSQPKKESCDQYVNKLSKISARCIMQRMSKTFILAPFKDIGFDVADNEAGPACRNPRKPCSHEVAGRAHGADHQRVELEAMAAGGRPQLQDCEFYQQMAERTMSLTGDVDFKRACDLAWGAATVLACHCVKRKSAYQQKLDVDREFCSRMRRFFHWILKHINELVKNGTMPVRLSTMTSAAHRPLITRLHLFKECCRVFPGMEFHESDFHLPEFWRLARIVFEESPYRRQGELSDPALLAQAGAGLSSSSQFHRSFVQTARARSARTSSQDFRVYEEQIHGGSGVGRCRALRLSIDVVVEVGGATHAFELNGPSHYLLPSHDPNGLRALTSSSPDPCGRAGGTVLKRFLLLQHNIELARPLPSLLPS
eukprot:415376-Hanusia_phi.AAC.3